MQTSPRSGGTSVEEELLCYKILYLIFTEDGKINGNCCEVYTFLYVTILIIFHTVMFMYYCYVNVLLLCYVVYVYVFLLLCYVFVMFVYYII
jgi:hypothetical protein